MLSELDNQLANLKPNNYEDLPAILDIEVIVLDWDSVLHILIWPLILY